LFNNGAPIPNEACLVTGFLTFVHEYKENMLKRKKLIAGTLYFINFEESLLHYDNDPT
jgi:hypothetical protein